MPFGDASAQHFAQLFAQHPAQHPAQYRAQHLALRRLRACTLALWMVLSGGRSAAVAAAASRPNRERFVVVGAVQALAL